MHYIIYLSAATNWPGKKELTEILTTSRLNNSNNELTGLLLYGSGKFIQLLEGDKDAIDETFLSISHDTRHKSVTVIASGELTDRNFPDWQMGFKTLDSVLLSTMEGYVNPLSGDFLNDGQELPLKLLKAFVKANRLDE